jgi:hypothetical protein
MEKWQDEVVARERAGKTYAKAAEAARADADAARGDAASYIIAQKNPRGLTSRAARKRGYSKS